MSEDNITEIMSKLKDIDSNTSSKTIMILQCITLLFVLGKPVLMHWIRAKYNVKDEPVNPANPEGWQAPRAEDGQTQRVQTIENQHAEDEFNDK